MIGLTHGQTEGYNALIFSAATTAATTTTTTTTTTQTVDWYDGIYVLKSDLLTAGRIIFWIIFVPFACIVGLYVIGLVCKACWWATKAGDKCKNGENFDEELQEIITVATKLPRPGFKTH